MAEKELINKLLTRWESLKTIRNRIDPVRWEAMAYANHRTKESSLTNSPVPVIRLYSSSGVLAIQNFINGFLGNLVSQNQNWASLRYEAEDLTEQDDIPSANEYLGKLQRKLMSELANSNFYAEDRMACMDAFTGGCSATFINNDEERNICVFNTLPPWDWWCDTNKYGVYDTFFYKKTMSAYRAYQQFGDKLPKDILKVAMSGGYDDEFDFLMCVMPRNTKLEGSTIFGKEKKYACVWLVLNNIGGGTGSGKKAWIVSEDGYDEFPVIIHAWDRDGDNPYGTSPVIKALPELRRLNMLTYETSLAVQKINHSPYVMTPAVSENFSDDPASKIVVSDMSQAPVPLQQSQTVDGALEIENRQEERIMRIFYNDMFNYLSRQDKVFTATQVNAVKSEELSLLSAIFGNIQSQKINKELKYVIRIMAENGRVPDNADKALEANGKLVIVLDSMLAQSLRAYTYRDSGMADMELAMQIANLASADPSWLDAMDNIDKNRLVRNIMFGNGTDPSCIVDKSKVEVIQKQRAQMQAQQMQQQQALAESEMIRNMGGASNMNNSTGANQYA